MHLLLADRLCCPRCGPEFGLILLADRLEDRRIYEGGLGCPNCRDSYPVRRGVGDLRAAPRAVLTTPGEAHTDSAAERVGEEVSTDGPADHPTAAEIGGLLGILRGPGHLLVLGALGARARSLADLIEGIEVVAAGASAPHGVTGSVEKSGVSRLIVRSTLPFQSRSLRGVALIEGDDGCDVVEAARVIAPGGRLAMWGAGPDSGALVRGVGLEVIAEEDTRLVARR